ncbi:MAG: precorrin-2 C(20)-methyltransferase [Porphyromonas sp.]|mgnify:FL=1|nr:precorrin-2 C(20)-methyltransferase [Porphyromonas sp.]
MTQAVYFVSLGAGDPELITLKALRLLERADVIYSPVSLSPNGRRASKSKSIMLSLGIKEEQIVSYDMPVNREREGAEDAYKQVAEDIKARRQANGDLIAAVVAIGDAGFYASSAYIGELLEAENIPTSYLPGVPALIASNALIGGQLVQLDEQLRVIPGVATPREWEEAWQSKHTVVIMKGSMAEEEIKRAMKSYPHRHWHYLEYVGYEGKELYLNDVNQIAERKFPYFSLIISKTR